MTQCVVEMECFRGMGDEMVVKELAILPLDGKLKTWLFDAPYSWEELNAKQMETNRWLTKHRHHLQFNQGDLPYACLKDVLVTYTKGYFIVTKGREKAELLERLTRRYVTNQQYDSKMADIVHYDCRRHSGCDKCAAIKALRLAGWLKAEGSNSSLF